MNNPSTSKHPREIEITAEDLPLHCPNPLMDPASWHPRVFLPIEASFDAMCPYCGTRYILKGGPVAGHH